MPCRKTEARTFDEALALHQQGRLEKARLGYIAALSLQPDHAWAAFHLGNVLAALHQPQEAIGYFARAATSKPGFAEAFNNLGAMLHWLGRHDESLTPLRTALLLRPDYGEAQFCLGHALQALNRNEEAWPCYRRAVALAPANAAALANLGTVLKLLDRSEQAMICYKATLTIEPAHTDAYYGLGNSLTALGRCKEAIGCYGRAIILQPDFAGAHNNLGIALQELHRLPEAVDHYRKAIVLHPEDPTFYNNLGGALQALDRTGEAMACYHKAIVLAPDYAEAYNNMGIVLTEAGNLDDAYRTFVKAIELAPRRGHFHRMLAETGHITPDSPELQRMEDLVRDIAALAEPEQMELHFALGRVYGDLAQHERSFRHLLAGNRLKRRSIVYDEAEAMALFERIRNVFTAECLAPEPTIEAPSPRPVFIVGMPRSGTTLVEQILASHPQIFGAGELLDLQQLVDGLDPIGGVAAFPEAIPLLPQERLLRLGTTYRDGLRARAPSASYVVDKMLNNFKLIGFIRLTLPDARIIHVSRDPIDTCLSCFSKLFVEEQLFSYDLAELGRYYHAYQTLMAHWRHVLPSGVMLDVRYEDVVADMKTEVQRILAHCGLTWDDRCLAFHRTRRVVRTASAAQVRRPLYGSSVGRWHVHGDLARPLVDALG